MAAFVQTDELASVGVSRAEYEEWGVLDICLSEFQVYHFGCTFCFIRAHLLLTEYD